LYCCTHRARGTAGTATAASFATRIRMSQVVKSQDSSKINELEAKKILEKIHSSDWVIALDERGRHYSSPAIAKELEGWRELGKDVVFIVGGANGLAPELLERADQQLSLSSLTFPHYLVRVLIAETLYRAWSISIGHPYHRQ
ncbi:MAG: 23S rRNA (pseudouridine(1915)-N(3))-methyltransferase RlmH, partial [Pseudomonadota bacterium]|nr:23S rRNA (pseudouridine(1915)-N(3))-methyltransferase RlmH [Pseudomonadota bacterium]